MRYVLIGYVNKVSYTNYIALAIAPFFGWIARASCAFFHGSSFPCHPSFCRWQAGPGQESMQAITRQSTGNQHILPHPPPSPIPNSNNIVYDKQYIYICIWIYVYVVCIYMIQCIYIYMYLYIYKWHHLRVWPTGKTYVGNEQVSFCFCMTCVLLWLPVATNKGW